MLGGFPPMSIVLASLRMLQPGIGFLLKSAPSMRSPMSGSGVKDFGTRNVVLQNSQVTTSDLAAWAGSAAPQFEQFNACIRPQGVGVGVSLGNGVTVGVSVGGTTTLVGVSVGNAVTVGVT